MFKSHMGFQPKASGRTMGFHKDVLNSVSHCDSVLIMSFSSFWNMLLAT